MIQSDWTRSTALFFVLMLACVGPIGAEAREADGAKPDGREAPRAEPAEGALVTLAFDRKRVQAGDTFTLTVRITRGSDVGHVPFHLSFDPTILRFERGTEGDVLSADGSGTAFVAAATLKGDAVVVGLSRLGRIDGVTGEGVLCKLEFTAIGPGDAKLAFARATVRDSTNHISPSAFRSPRLVVN